MPLRQGWRGDGSRRASANGSAFEKSRSDRIGVDLMVAKAGNLQRQSCDLHHIVRRSESAQRVGLGGRYGTPRPCVAGAALAGTRSPGIRPQRHCVYQHFEAPSRHGGFRVRIPSSRSAARRPRGRSCSWFTRQFCDGIALEHFERRQPLPARLNRQAVRLRAESAELVDFHFEITRQEQTLSAERKQVLRYSARRARPLSIISRASGSSAVVIALLTSIARYSWRRSRPSVARSSCVLAGARSDS